MAYEQKPGQGSLFKNNRKEKETHPDMHGTIMTPDGKTWRVSAWTKTPKAGGDRFLSLSIQEPREQQSEADMAPTPAHKVDIPQDDLPF